MNEDKIGIFFAQSDFAECDLLLISDAPIGYDADSLADVAWELGLAGPFDEDRIVDAYCEERCRLNDSRSMVGLYGSRTGEYLRRATKDEIVRSSDAGPEGHIITEHEGAVLSAYVGD